MLAVSRSQDPVVYKALRLHFSPFYFLFLVSKPDHFPLLILTVEMLLTLVETEFPVVIKTTGARIKEGLFFFFFLVVHTLKLERYRED